MEKIMKGGIKMERKQILGVFALAFVALLGVSLVSAQGLGMFDRGMMNGQPEGMQEHRDAMQDAVEAGDYDAWAELMQERVSEMRARVDEFAGSINETTFAEIQERHESMSEFHEAMEAARESGDFTLVESLKEEFGVGQNGFGGKGAMRDGLGMGPGMHRN